MNKKFRQGENAYGMKVLLIILSHSRFSCIKFHDLVSELSRNQVVDVTIVLFFTSVVATLKDAADADEAVAKLNQKAFRGSEANVRIYPTNKLLCVAQLPSQMSEKAFHELVGTYGEVERCFLMTTATGMVFRGRP